MRDSTAFPTVRVRFGVENKYSIVQSRALPHHPRAIPEMQARFTRARWIFDILPPEPRTELGSFRHFFSWPPASPSAWNSRRAPRR